MKEASEVYECSCQNVGVIGVGREGHPKGPLTREGAHQASQAKCGDAREIEDGKKSSVGWGLLETCETGTSSVGRLTASELC